MHCSIRTSRSIHYQQSQGLYHDTKTATSLMLEDVATNKKHELRSLLRRQAVPLALARTRTDFRTPIRTAMATMTEGRVEDMVAIEGHLACRTDHRDTMTEDHHLLLVHESQRIDRLTALYHEGLHRTVISYLQDLTMCRVDRRKSQHEDHHHPSEHLLEADRTWTHTYLHIRVANDRDMMIVAHCHHETTEEILTIDHVETAVKATETHTAIQMHHRHGRIATMAQDGHQGLEATRIEIEDILHHETSSGGRGAEVPTGYVEKDFRIGSGIFTGVRSAEDSGAIVAWARLDVRMPLLA